MGEKILVLETVQRWIQRALLDFKAVSEILSMRRRIR
jgi:hypothetical protein